MNRFFNYHNNLCNGTNTHNVFAYDPYIISIKELLVNELRRIVYYIEKLKDLKQDMSVYSDKVIDFISTIIVNLDFKKESFFIIVEDLYNNRKKLEKIYISECKKRNKKYNLITDSPEFTSKENILKALNKYKIDIKETKNEINPNNKYLCEIIMNIILSSCNSLIELKKLNVDFPKAQNIILQLLNCSNIISLSEQELLEIIQKLSTCNYQIMKLLYKTIVEKFGPPIKRKVLIRAKKGKSILVSGSSLLELEKLLEAVKESDINVYTHNDMISAFCFKKFSKYPNLVGNYRKEGNNLFVDFASFPGPIYVSKNSVIKTDVIRGQIYTGAKYPAYGIGRIPNDDFSELINYSLNNNGFDDDEKEEFFEIGYSLDDVENMISNIIEKFHKNEIRRVFIIGLFDGLNTNNNYIKSFFNEVDESDFIISFAYDSNRKNFFKVNSFYDFSILYKIIETIKEKEPAIISKLSIFMPDCNVQTILHILNLIQLKIKNIFLGQCCPNVVNPAIISILSEIYLIKELSEPKKDIKKI